MMRPTLRKRLLRSLSRLIGWFFGTFWALLGASALSTSYVRAGYALAAVTALIFLARLWKNAAQASDAGALFRAPVYFIAVFAELVGMYLAALLLPRIGAQEQVYSAIGCIVGLHFIGLWLATRSRRFLAITAGMCCVSLFSMMIPFRWHAIGLRYVVLGAGNAMVLWLAASGTE
jgi:hypothetical protein